MLAFVTVALRVCWLSLQRVCWLWLRWPSGYAGLGYSGPQSMLALVTVGLEYAGFRYSGPQSMLAFVTESMLALVTVALTVYWLWLQWPSEYAGFGYSGPQCRLALVTVALRVCWLWLHCRFIRFWSSCPQNEMALVTMSAFLLLYLEQSFWHFFGSKLVELMCHVFTRMPGESCR